MINININAGVLLGSLAGLIVPQDADEPSYIESNAWRFVFAGPIVLQFV